MFPRLLQHQRNQKSGRKMATMIAGLLHEFNQNGSHTGSNTSDGSKTTKCTFKYFNSCNPTKFSGTQGATDLLQWFESMENTFVHTECPDNLRVRYATSVFQKRALTWWNGEKQNRGMDAALALTWEELKELMIQEFCPMSELQKLENEFWNLEQDSGNHQAYANRFHELSLLVPHMVNTPTRAINRFVRGLPLQVQDAVIGSKATTLPEVIRLSALVTENHILKGTLTKKGGKRTAEASSSAAKETKTGSNKKRKAQSFAVTNQAPRNQAPAPQVPAPPAPVSLVTLVLILSATPVSFITLQLTHAVNVLPVTVTVT